MVSKDSENIWWGWVVITACKKRRVEFKFKGSQKQTWKPQSAFMLGEVE